MTDLKFLPAGYLGGAARRRRNPAGAALRPAGGLGLVVAKSTGTCGHGRPRAHCAARPHSAALPASKNVRGIGGDATTHVCIGSAIAAGGTRHCLDLTCAGDAFLLPRVARALFGR